ncbi:glycosyltransferase family 4 protein [Methanobrevibacter sp.]
MNKKLKIAVFYSIPNGGEIKSINDNLEFLKREGHYIDVYTFDIYKSDESFAPIKNFVDNYYIYPVKRTNIRKILFGIVNKIIPSVNIPDTSRLVMSFKEVKNTQKKIAEEINNKDYDLILVWKEAIFTNSPALLEYATKPTIYYCNDPLRTEKVITDMTEKFDRKFNVIYSKVFGQKYIDLDRAYAEYATRILVNSDYSHETLLRVYGLNSQTSYLGSNTDFFKCLNLKRENFVLSVGYMAPPKGFDFIVKSIGKIDKEIRPKLVITSYSSVSYWKNYIEQLAKDCDVELEILINIDYEELVTLYNKAKLFVFGSYLEPFGLVTLEAMACGTPVVVVKEGGQREIVQHGKNGFLIDRNEKKFAAAISELLTNEELWEKFSKEGMEHVNNYWTLEHGGQRLLDHIYNLLDEK